MRDKIVSKIQYIEEELEKKIDELRRLHNIYKTTEIKIQTLRENKNLLEELLHEEEQAH